MRRMFALILAASLVFAEAGGQETAAPNDPTNRSGAARRTENVRRPGPLFARVDTDGDGKVTRQEMPRMPKDRFDAIDENKDGVLDQAEFQTLMSRTTRKPAAQWTPRINKTLLKELNGDYWPKTHRVPEKIDGETLPTENVSGDGIWLDPALQNLGNELFRVTVWFDQQFLGDGEAYARRCQGFSGQLRGPLCARVINTLKTISDQSYQAAEDELRKLAEDDKVFLIDWHWIVNGFSCVTTADGLIGLQKLPGVKKIFLVRGGLNVPSKSGDRETVFFPPVQRPSFEPSKYEHPWYTRYLLADKVWKRFGVSGEGTLNVVMDGGFVLSPSTTSNLYRNDREVPDNGKDDDQNGLVDDYHGFDFSRGTPLQTVRPPENLRKFTGVLHGFTCASLICGTGNEASPYEFGLAPQGSWAGVTANVRFESAIEWAIEQGADTLSMSFSRPNLGELRSHWRKVMEHTSLCGVCCTSGAGNFAKEGSSSYAPVPVQLRTPEDIPLAVFAPAGVQRDLGSAPTRLSPGIDSTRTYTAPRTPTSWPDTPFQHHLVNGLRGNGSRSSSWRRWRSVRLRQSLTRSMRKAGEAEQVDAISERMQNADSDDERLEYVARQTWLRRWKPGRMPPARDTFTNRIGAGRGAVA